MKKTNIDFDTIQKAIHQYMTLDSSNDHVIDLLIATALSVELEKPVWLMIVAPPSSGKTELLKIISGVKGYHQICDLTSKTLLSAHSVAGGGYMLREVKERGILAFPDFTTVTSGGSNERREIFNQLRVIYDGEASRGSGIDTEKPKLWKGKVAVIACVTETIERVKDTSNDLGERFLYYRYRPTELLAAPQVIEGLGQLRKKLPRMVNNILASKRADLARVNLMPKESEHILSLARFVAIGRAAVERDGYSREIVLAHEPEQPYRVLAALTNLYKCLKCIHDNSTERPIRVVQEVALSTIPAKRLQVLRTLATSTNGMKMKDIAAKLDVAETPVRRIVEEMCAQKMVANSSPGNGVMGAYTIHRRFLPLLEIATQPGVTFSEKVVDQIDNTCSTNSGKVVLTGLPHVPHPLALPLTASIATVN